MLFKSGDAVICVSNISFDGSNFKHSLTVGKAYIVDAVDDKEDMIRILNDENSYIWYMTNRFNFLNESA